MERRDFLIGGAVGGASILGGLGGGGGLLGDGEARASEISYDGEDITAADMRRVVEKLDGHMARSRTKAHLPALVPELARAAPSLSASEREDVARGERLYQDAIRSMLLVGTMRALPLRGQLHPGMQRRMVAGQNEMASAVFGMTTMLEEMPAAERIDVARALRDKPDLAMRTVGLIDAQAAAVGIPMNRRVQIREMARHITWRMRSQSASAVIDEYSDMVHKLTEQPVTLEAMQRRMMARMGERKFREMEERVRIAHASWQVDDDLPLKTGGAGLAPPPALVDPQGRPLRSSQQPRVAGAREEEQELTDDDRPPNVAPPEPPGTKALHTAYVLFGIGVGLAVTGTILLFFVLGLYALFFYTPAGLLILAGLIALIVGLAQRYG